jgi:altronate dehydratase
MERGLTVRPDSPSLRVERGPGGEVFFWSIYNLNLSEFTPAGRVSLREVAVHLNLNDNVAIAKTALRPDTTLVLDDSSEVITCAFIPSGHKIALTAIPVGEVILRYGQIIGFAADEIAPGDHVHTHNVELGTFERDYAFGADARPVNLVPEEERRTFLGYRRSDGRVGTRNFIAVIASVNCSAHTAREIARYFTPQRLAPYPNVDGVIALTHTSGCAYNVASADSQLLMRTLAGMATHPNVAGCIFVGLGCETNQIAELAERFRLEDAALLNIQDLGGIRKTVAAGIEAVEALLPAANAVQRAPQLISDLTLALQCGGSDGWSGVTANPLVGLVADEIVRQGGSVVLAETPEIYGAEPMLTRRAIRAEVGQKLLQKVRWWEDHAARLGEEINNNPSTGNKAGGLTTIYEKSLGAVAKGGSTPLTGVYDYAERITTRGLGFMDSPGYDPVGITGQVAGGCNLVLFTTGRGSVFGFKPAPSIKIATNTRIYEHMSDDMDFNAGRVLERESMNELAADLLDLVIRVASGQPSKSEAQDVGEAEFVPWGLGGIL